MYCSINNKYTIQIKLLILFGYNVSETILIPSGMNAREMSSVSVFSFGKCSLFTDMIEVC